MSEFAGLAKDGCNLLSYFNFTVVLHFTALTYYGEAALFLLEDSNFSLCIVSIIVFRISKLPQSVIYH